MANQWQRINLRVTGITIDIARASAIEVQNQVFQNTPVDKGQLINSWNTSLGAPESEKRTGTPSATEARNQALTITEKLNIGQILYFNNPMPYANRIEYEGWSAKSPSGMVGISVRMWPEIVAQKTRDLTR